MARTIRTEAIAFHRSMTVFYNYIYEFNALIRVKYSNVRRSLHHIDDFQYVCEKSKLQLKKMPTRFDMCKMYAISVWWQRIRRKKTTQAINLFIYTITSINGLDFEESRIYIFFSCSLMHFYLKPLTANWFRNQLKIIILTCFYISSLLLFSFKLKCFNCVTCRNLDICYCDKVIDFVTRVFFDF